MTAKKMNFSKHVLFYKCQVWVWTLICPILLTVHILLIILLFSSSTSQ